MAGKLPIHPGLRTIGRMANVGQGWLELNGGFLRTFLSHCTKCPELSVQHCTDSFGSHHAPVW